MPRIIPSSLLSLTTVMLFLAGCSSSKEFSGFSYDPEGVTVTTDKEITPQHRRTIGVSRDGIWVTNEFAGARMNDFYKVDDSLYRVVLEPENHPINNSTWYSFKVWADTIKNIKLQLAYEHGDHRYYPELSRDGRTWTSIDSTSFAVDTVAGTATLQLEVSPEPLWVSAQELLTAEDYELWADSLTQKPYIRRETVGLSHQNRPVQKLTIDEVSTNGTRGVLIITGRLHPPEVTGALASMIFIEELASESELAKAFRSHFEVLAYPLANPDGVQNGHWRHNAGGIDLNRDWQNFNQPETRAIRDDLLASVKKDPSKKVYYGIDFHSTNENIFYPINRDIQTFPDDFTYRWTDSLIAAFPDTEFEVEPFDTSSPITKNWIFHTFGADAVTYEVDDGADREKLKAIARKSAQLIMKLLLEEKKNQYQSSR